MWTQQGAALTCSPTTVNYTDSGMRAGKLLSGKPSITFIQCADLFLLIADD